VTSILCDLFFAKLCRRFGNNDSRHNSVYKVIRLWAGELRSLGSIPKRTKKHFPETSRPAVGHIQSAVLLVPGDLWLVENQARPNSIYWTAAIRPNYHLFVPEFVVTAQTNSIFK